MPRTPERGGVTVAAILKGEDRFVEEWLVYHRLLGVEFFILYDNDPRLPLRSLTAAYAAWVDAIPWPDGQDLSGSRNRQTKAYMDAVARCRTEWIAFLDGDEFIVLRRHAALGPFLSDLGDADAILLTWHVFGHNGFYDDPPGLITAALNRRMSSPGRQTKTIARTAAIDRIETVHACTLKIGCHSVDANGRDFSPADYPGKTSVAHINHYMCRSFRTWMNRVDRGDTHHTRQNYPRDANHRWRFEHDACLRKFVEISATCHEVQDDYLLKYQTSIEQEIARARREAGPPGFAIAGPE